MDVNEQDRYEIRPEKPHTAHILISRRDSVSNDLKNSTWQGILSFGLSLAGCVILFLTIYYSYRSEGQAGYEAGFFLLIDLLIAVISIVLGRAGNKNRKKIRHYMEKRGIVIGCLLIVILLILFIRGIPLVMEKYL